MPPLLEHLESLLSGTGRELDLKTFKLVDQLRWFAHARRARRHTPQVARASTRTCSTAAADRLCYCGPVLQYPAERPARHASRCSSAPRSTATPGLEADLEALELALDALLRAGVPGVTVDLGDARIVRGVLAGAGVGAAVSPALHDALAAKVAARWPCTRRARRRRGRVRCRRCCACLAAPRSSPPRASATGAIPGAPHARRPGNGSPPTAPRLSAGGHRLLTWRTSAATTSTAVPFAVYTEGGIDALVRRTLRRGRRGVQPQSGPAAGFSLDVKQVAAFAGRRCCQAQCARHGARMRRCARRAAAARAGRVGRLRAAGHGHEGEEIACDHELGRPRGNGRYARCADRSVRIPRKSRPNEQ